MKIFILFLVTLFLQGCMFAPHRSVVLPEVKGYVLCKKDNKPAKNAIVTYRYGDSPLLDKTEVEDNGTFSIGPIFRWHWFIYLGSPGRAPAPAWVEYGFLPPTWQVEYPEEILIYIEDEDGQDHLITNANAKLNLN